MWSRRQGMENDLKDLQNQKLSRDEIYNIWCDRMANMEWEHGMPQCDDPDVSPYEKWAIYSCHSTYHNIIGNLSTSIPTALSYHSTSQYIVEKHKIS
jgi:hypothetical protein